MEALEAMLTRRSVRAYTDEMPPRELIDKVVEAGMYAPTGKNTQSPTIVVVTNRALRDELSRLNAEVIGKDFDPFYGAPCIIIVLADRNCNRSHGTYINDGSLVLGNMMNAAHALGLGSCWIHRARQIFASERGQELLRQWGIEGDIEGIGHLALGYAAKEPAPASPRKEGYVRYVE
ncbi:MAG: nitroreductase [Bacteroidales bacterium]|nr:nitroreductase [Bacteroidales bacterium]